MSAPAAPAAAAIASAVATARKDGLVTILVPGSSCGESAFPSRVASARPSSDNGGSLRPQ